MPHSGKHGLVPTFFKLKPLSFCVYCFIIWNGDMLVKWLSEQLWRWSSCGPSSYRVTADTDITVIMCSRQNCAIHSHRDPQNMHACFNSSLLLYNIHRHWFWTHIWLSVQSCFRIHYAKFPNSVTLHVVLKIFFLWLDAAVPSAI